jgi:hypothetical protein
VVELYAYEWGIDSARNVTEDLFQCVIRNFGYPRFWGRYLVRVPRVSEGLTKEEIAFIRGKGIKILPIYNAIQEATGYEKGKAAAENASSQAQILGIPKGVPLFANLEQFFRIDAEWIQGWTKFIAENGYLSGIYNDPVTGSFQEAFCNAAQEDERIKALTILWSAQPELEPSGPGNPPYYMPESPVCGGNVWVWQYSRKVTLCPIDTNLAYSRFVNILW